MALRGAGGGDRPLSRQFERYHRTKRRFRHADDFDDYYVSDRDSLPPDAKRVVRPSAFDCHAEVPFLVEPRPSTGRDFSVDPEWRGPTPSSSSMMAAAGPRPLIHHHYHHWTSEPSYSPDPDSGSEIMEPFLVRRGDEPARRSKLSATPAAAPPMERTASGLAIHSSIGERCASTELLEDDVAANRVREHIAHFQRRNPDSKHERILRSIISPRALATEFPLDDASLESIFSAANAIFYQGRLSQRVKWDWSHEASTQYARQVIGTTALRIASRRGFETLIVLSSPILRDRKYSRRLLISTFLHELIHSYLFICCGFRASHCGGHTPGFRTIARLIDDWAGPESQLHLGKMEADLESFRLGRERSPSPLGHVLGPSDRHDDNAIYPCSGFEEHSNVAYDDTEPEYEAKYEPGQGRPVAHRGMTWPAEDYTPQYVPAEDPPPSVAASQWPPARLWTPPRYDDRFG